MTPLPTKGKTHVYLLLLAAQFVSLSILLGQPALAVAGISSDEDSMEGTLIADLGFRPDVDGFSFSNYGGEKSYQGLTPEDLKRMAGDQVCVSQPKGECILTPTWTYWMEMVNAIADGGHCQGMAVLSLLFYEKLINVTDFGAESTHDLTIAGNGVLQKEIAYWFAHQLLEPTMSSGINEKPSKILDLLIASFQDENRTKRYTIAISERNGTDGHAITPFAVRDVGNGICQILVYDNNYPDQTCIVEVDRINESWTYQGGTSPLGETYVYEGDADSLNLELIPISVQLVPQNCTSCNEEVCEIWAEGETSILIIDAKQRMLGFVNGKLENEIPGARVIYPLTGLENDTSPIYIMPLQESFIVILQGINPDEQVASNLTILAPEYVLYIEDISLSPGQSDVIAVNPQQSFMGDPTTTTFDYLPGGPESPTITVATLDNDTHYVFAVTGHDLQEGMTLETAINMNTDVFGFGHTNSTADYIYDVAVARTDQSGEQVFGHEGIKIKPDCVAFLQYDNWTGNQSPKPMTLLCGEQIETVDLVDMTDQMP
ncbi:Uncharacterised protein [uncultured archaeon]|nr:Uncharacterised protein [uncultured archaeon]